MTEDPTSAKAPDEGPQPTADVPAPEPTGADAAAAPPAALSTASDPAPPSAAAPPSAIPGAPRYRASYLFLVGVSIVSLAADLLSKAWAVAHLDSPDHLLRRAARHQVLALHNVVGTKVDLFLDFYFAKNRGGAWGLLQEESETIRRPFFLAVSVIAIVFIVSLYRRLQPNQRVLRWGLPLVLGGALGNLINRVQYNFVVDFIDAFAIVNEREHHWPTFNIADVAICVGVGLMAIDMFSTRRPAPGRAAPPGADRDATVAPSAKET